MSNPIIRLLIVVCVAVSFPGFLAAQEKVKQFAEDELRLTELVEKHQQMQRELEVQYTKLGTEHPRAKKTKASLDQVAYFIREAKVGMGILDDAAALEKVKVKTKELFAAVSELQPLFGNEKELNSAMAELKKAISMLEAKKEVKEVIDLKMAKERLVEMEQNLKIDREKALQHRQILLASDYAAMKDQLAMAQKTKAKMEMQRALEFMALAELKQKETSNSDDVTGFDSQQSRLEKLESDVSDIKAMLKKLLEK